MKKTINGTSYNFEFGIKFLRELDKLFAPEVSGMQMKYGFGLDLTINTLISAQPQIVSNYLLAANSTETPRIGQEELDAWIEDQEDIEPIASEIVEAMEAKNMLAKKVKAAKASLKAAQKEENQN